MLCARPEDVQISCTATIALGQSLPAGLDMTETLLIVGMAAAVVFVAVLIIEGAQTSPRQHAQAEVQLVVRISRQTAGRV
jgi:hypothetical protein